MNWQAIQQWLADLDWARLVPELVGKGLGFLTGFVVSWYFLFRKRIRELQKFQQGDSDDVLYQAHYLLPAPAGRQMLVFRNVTTKLTVHQLYDNPAARQLARQLTDQTTLDDPILPTSGTLGFELLNDAANFVAGALATSPHTKRIWLMAMTCEDRVAVRRRCIRCFLLQEEDLKRFTDWTWVRSNVCVEKPWHWFRLVALHRIARVAEAESARFNRLESDQAMPLVDAQHEHRRLVRLSLGLPDSEIAVAEPFSIDWSQHSEILDEWGVRLQEG